MELELLLEVAQRAGHVRVPCGSRVRALSPFGWTEANALPEALHLPHALKLNHGAGRHTAALESWVRVIGSSLKG